MLGWCVECKFNQNSVMHKPVVFTVPFEDASFFPNMILSPVANKAVYQWNMFQTGVSGAFHSIPSLLLPLSKLMFNTLNSESASK